MTRLELGLKSLPLLSVSVIDASLTISFVFVTVIVFLADIEKFAPPLCECDGCAGRQPHVTTSVGGKPFARKLVGGQTPSQGLPILS